MIKLLGTAMIVLGSGSAGFGFARAVRAQLRQLNALLAALEAMKGEIEYRLTPLPGLFAALGEGTEPVTAAFFRGCAAMMEADRALPPQLVLGIWPFHSGSLTLAGRCAPSSWHRSGCARSWRRYRPGAVRAAGAMKRSGSAPGWRWR